MQKKLTAVLLSATLLISFVFIALADDAIHLPLIYGGDSANAGVTVTATTSTATLPATATPMATSTATSPAATANLTTAQAFGKMKPFTSNIMTWTSALGTRQMVTIITTRTPSAWPSS